MNKILLFIGMFCASFSWAQTIRYVKVGGAGNGSGSSWTNASSSLQAMINASSSNDQVWVAGGTYKPTTGSDRNASFSMKAGVFIYGSFAGTENSLTQRTLAVRAANPSILSGDLNGDDIVTGTGSTLSITNNTENVYHVINNSINSLTTSNCLLDGFTITGGNAADNDSGGGMYNLVSAPALSNIVFKANRGGGGAALSNTSASPSINNVVFIENMAVGSGGALLNINASPAITNSIFYGNNAGASGGGIINLSSSSATIINTIFYGNNVANEGGAMFNDASTVTVRNCVLWTNRKAGSTINSIYGTTTVSYSDVELSSGTYSGTGNINQSPAFFNAANPQGADGIFFTTDDGLQVLACSPLIEAGANFSLGATDIISNTRIYGVRADIGAYEFQGNQLTTSRLFVNASAAANGDGVSWATAFTDLQDALSLAASCSNITEIWVAKGTYKPTTGNDQIISFSMLPNVKIYGSFAGSETSLSQRTSSVIAANPSILSGDLSNNDVVTGTGSTLSITNNSDNSYHVVQNIDNGLTNSNSLLDGFTIKGGNAVWGGGMQNFRSSPAIANTIFINNYAIDGGGMWNNDASVSLSNVTFSNNYASLTGGGMYNFSCSPILNNISFSGNLSSTYGGGIYNSSSTPTLNNVSFTGNVALSYGGGMYNHQSPCTISSTIFSQNTGDAGGGIYNNESSTNISNSFFYANIATVTGGGGINNSSSSPTITNSVFANNTANTNGGGMLNTQCPNTHLRNITFSKNNAGSSGGGIYNDNSYNTSIWNGILWGNTQGGTTVSSTSGNPCRAYSSNVELISGVDGTGGGNINQNPLFVNANNPAGTDGFFLTTDDGLALQSCSPSLNKGINLYNSSTNDIIGNPRIFANTIDMGAYEYQNYPCTATVWNGSSWSNGNPTSSLDAYIASSIAPSSFTSKSLIINTSVALTTTGITATINGNIENYGNGIAGTGTVRINANSSITGNAITIPASATLNLNTGTLTTGGLLRIAPGGSITGNYTNISGNVTLQQNIIGQRGFRIFANPFTTATNIANLASANGITINTTAQVSGLTDSRSFDHTSNAWNNITSTTWAANTPYALFIRGLASEVSGLTYTGGPSAFTYNVSGVLNGNSVAVNATHATNFMVVGNPYAAPVNTSALTNGAGKSYYVYQIVQGGNTNAQRTKAGGWVAVLSSSNTTTIPVLGAIAYQPGIVNYNISNTDINTGGTPTTGLFNTNNSVKNIELIVEQNAQLQDKLFIRADANTTANANDANDLQKFYNENVNIYTKSTDKKDLAIDARNNFTDSIILGISGLVGDYNFRLANHSIDNVRVFLKDKFLQTKIELQANAVYPFSITTNAASKGENRFQLVFQSKAPVDIANNNTDGFSAKVLNTVITNGQLRILVNSIKPASIQVVDVNGKGIASKAAVNGTNQLSIQHAAKGMYIVRISDGANVVTEKIVVD